MPQVNDANGSKLPLPTIDVVQDPFAVTASHAESAALNAATVAVTLISTTNCWLKFGDSPVASAHGSGCFYLPAGQALRFAIDKVATGANTKFSAIRDTADGYLSIIEHA